MNNKTISYHLDDDEIDEEIEAYFKSHGSEPCDPSEPSTKAYQLYDGPRLEKDEQPLQKVIGHEPQKKELLCVLDWFNRSKELRSKGLSLPRGCVLTGAMGNGKSMIIREFIRCVDAPVFLFKGSDNSICDDIREAFDQARLSEKAVIVFDELDLLINKERRVARVLQECLDGVESGGNILVLAATNSIHELPNALTRPGRLDKVIRIPDPSEKEAVALLKKFFADFNVALPENFDEEEMELALDGLSCAGVKSVVNDVLLRNGFEGITMDMIQDSIMAVTSVIKGPEEKPIMDVCIHEASHLVMCLAHPEHFTIKHLDVDGASGCFRAKEVVSDFWPYAKAIADIEICMAGVLGQKLFCKTGSRGCEEDLQRARQSAYNLFNISGYSSTWETLPVVSSYSREETPWKRRRNERKIERFLRRTERRTRRYLKRHEAQVRCLSEELFKKHSLTSSEILAILNTVPKTPAKAKAELPLATPAMAYPTKAHD